MNKSVMIPLIIAGTLIIVGGVLAFMGLSNNFKWEWGIGSTEIRPVSIEITEDFDELKIEEISGDILLAASDDGKCRVESWETDRQKLTAEVVNGRLYVAREGREEWTLFFGRDISKHKTVVYLPKYKYEKAELKTTSGEIHTAVKLEIGELSLHTTSGGIELAEVTADLAAVTSTSGEISLNDITAGDLLVSATSGGIALNKVTAGKTAISCTSGDIFLRNITAGALTASNTSGSIELAAAECGSVELKTNSGELEMDDVSAESSVKMKTTSGEISCARIKGAAVTLKSISGEIEFEHLKGEEIQLESTSGDIEGSIIGPMMRYSAKSISGRVRIPEEQSDGGSCRAATTSGDIQIREISE